MWSVILIAFTILFVFFYSCLIKLRARKTRKPRKSSGSFALPVDKTERRYMSKNVPLLLQSYGVFSASYLSRFASSYLASGHTPKPEEQELLPGVEPSRASWVLNHCMRLASARYNAERTIKEGRAAEASSVDVKVQRACKSCERVPAEKNYSLSSAPVYPCADCKEGDFCIFWYKLNF